MNKLFRKVVFLTRILRDFPEKGYKKGRTSNPACLRRKTNALKH